MARNRSRGMQTKIKAWTRNCIRSVRRMKHRRQMEEEEYGEEGRKNRGRHSGGQSILGIWRSFASIRIDFLALKLDSDP